MNSREIAKAYFLSGAITIVATGFVALLSGNFPPVSLEISTKVLENVIQLDGLLFGFTAVMFTIIYGKKPQMTHKKEVTITVFMLTSFFCYLFSIGTSFLCLMQQLTTGVILTPAVLAIVGAVFSSLYVVMILMEDEKKEKMLSHE